MLASNTGSFSCRAPQKTGCGSVGLLHLHSGGRGKRIKCSRSSLIVWQFEDSLGYKDTRSQKNFFKKSYLCSWSHSGPKFKTTAPLGVPGELLKIRKCWVCLHHHLFQSQLHPSSSTPLLVCMSLMQRGKDTSRSESLFTGPLPIKSLILPIWLRS